MLVRLVLGLLKGLVVGGLVGFGLAKIGVAAPGAIIAYLTSALVGALVGLVAGKPIWAAGGKIEAGLKAGFGALLAVGLMWLTRKFLTMGIPVDLGSLAEPNAALQQAGPTIGGAAITSLPVVGAVLGAFYDADNTPDPEGNKDEAAAAQAKGSPPKARIGADLDALDDEELADEDAAKKQTKK